MKVTKELFDRLEVLVERTNVDGRLAGPVTGLKGEKFGYQLSHIEGGCGCCDRDSGLTLDGLLAFENKLEDALGAVKEIRAMIQREEVNLGETLEVVEDV